MKCPLCSSQATEKSKVNSDLIVRLWAKRGVGVSNLFETNTISKFKCTNCGVGFYYPPCPGDDAFYGKLASWEWYYKHSGKSEYNVAANLIKPGMRIIDVGCGIGEFSTHLAVGVDFVGAELSSKSVYIAKSLGRNVNQIDITKAPQEYVNNFDVVTCFQVLEHIVSLHEFFFGLVNLCKPGGIIVIAVPNNDGFVGDAVNNIFNMPPHHILLWNKSSLHYLAKQYGLNVVDYTEEPLSDVHRYWGFTVVINKILLRFIGSSPKVIDISILGRFIYKASALLARLVSNFNARLVPSGHSAIIVLRKPDNE